VADEEQNWPEPANLKPAEAMRLLDSKQSAATAANKAADDAKKDKDKATVIALQVLDMYELGSADARMDDGNRVLFYTEQFRTYVVKDPELFDPWEAEQDENYYEVKRVLRGQVFLDYCKHLVDNGEGLPPGVEEYTETRLRRKAK
jgi:hypothetical protein